MMKKGFTLAEVLITLGVIGVVAALTLPGIMQSYQKKVYIAQMQRVFNEVSNGARSYIHREGVEKLDEGGRLASSTEDFVTNFLTATNTGSASNFFESSYNSIDSAKSVSLGTIDGTCASLDSGASVCVTKMSGGSSTIYVDLNGKARPNIIGRDFFVFKLKDTGKISNASANKSKCTSAASLTDAEACFGVLREGNWSMDY